ncbi:MAG: hypothetical protein ACNA7E_06440 [Wenzhouxiangellaceae bacterium]
MNAKSPHSLEALREFLRQAATEGLINPAAARARRRAVEQLESELLPDEREDIRRIEIGALVSRFHQLEGTSIRPEALELYAQRFENGLREYLSWLDNPAGFMGARRERARAWFRDSEQDPEAAEKRKADEEIALQATENPRHIVPVPIRDGHVVYLANLPLDLTRAEAQRIAGVVLAYAGGNDDDREEDA